MAALTAAPPGTTRLMALPASIEVVTEYQAFVRSAMRWSTMVHTKEPTSNARARVNQIGWSEVSFGNELNTASRLGKTR